LETGSPESGSQQIGGGDALLWRIAIFVGGHTGFQ